MWYFLQSLIALIKSSSLKSWSNTATFKLSVLEYILVLWTTFEAKPPLTFLNLKLTLLLNSSLLLIKSWICLKYNSSCKPSTEPWYVTTAFCLKPPIII